MSWLGFAGNVLLTVSSDTETTGGSVLPFISFMMFLFGIVIFVIGIAMVHTTRKDWKLFYAPHDWEAMDPKDKKKAFLKGRIVYAIGLLLFFASFFVK